MNKAPSDKKIIFLLHEGLPPNIVESQVLTHAASMRDAGLEIEVWSFAVTSSSYASATSALINIRKAYPGIVIRLFRGVKPALPYSELVNALLLFWWLWRLKVKPAIVHARTEHSTMIASIIKRFYKYSLIWDARGDTLSEFIDSSAHISGWLRFLVPLKIHALNKRLNVAASNCDKAIFVSNSLYQLHKRSLKGKEGIVIPCLADERKFFFDPDIRLKARQDLGFQPDDVVIAYVGSTARWQCISETINLIKDALEQSKRCRALIVTPSVDEFKMNFSAKFRDRIVIKSATLNEINELLNAADYGIMLREENPINWVASPVKFAEYSLTGLQVVSTQAIDQVNEYAVQFGNIISKKDLLRKIDDFRFTPLERHAISLRARKKLSRDVYKNNLLAFYKSLFLP